MTDLQPGLLTAVNAMYDATTAEEAQAAARDFLDAGASPADVAALLAEFDRTHVKPLPVWEDDDSEPDDDYPSVVIRCKCSHAPSAHSEVTGKCWSVVCGCTRFRLKEDE